MLRYGLIGTGMMGREHIRNIALLPDIELGAFYEPDPEQAAQAAALAPDAARAESLGALLARPDLDALILASPNHLHVAQLAQIAAAGARPVLVEKPVYTNAADRALLAQLERDYRAPIWVAMEYRYMPALAGFLAQCDGVTGGVQMLSIREHRFPFLDKVGHWNRFNAKTGGTLVEKCCHFFDLMRLVLRDEPLRIMASGGQVVNYKTERYPDGAPDIWDHAYVIVEFSRGARAMLDLCMFAEGARFQEEIAAMGADGKIEARVPGPLRFWPSDAGPAPDAEIEISPRAPKAPLRRVVPVDRALLEAGDHNGATFYQHQRFAAVVAGRAAPEVTLSDGIKAVDMGRAAQASARSGQAVLLSDRSRWDV